MSSLDYLEVEEIAAHESAMQAVRDKRAAAVQGLRDEIARLHRELEERLAREVKVTHEKEEIELESLIVEKERRIVLRRIYHEAPDDIMELIVKLFSDVHEYGWGKGGMNALRLVSKRLMRMVDSCATRLTQLDSNGPESFLLAPKRCRRLDHIILYGYKLKSLEGCPDGLKSLVISYGDSLQSLEPLRGCTELESLEIGYALEISDLSPLNSCTRLKKLRVRGSKVTDISALASMSLLEEIELSKCKFEVQSYINDISPLAQCKMLRKLNIGGNRDIEDISPLARCTQLEVLEMWGLTKLTDLKPLSSLTKLRILDINSVPVEDLAPLSALQDLEWLDCYGIPVTTSLLPLARCIKLKMICCHENSKYLDFLRERRTDIEIATMREQLDYD